VPIFTDVIQSAEHVLGKDVAELQAVSTRFRQSGKTA